MRINSLFNQLSGCAYAVRASKELVMLCVVRLATCDQHEGCHHFYVVDDGRVVGMSHIGAHCIKTAGIPVEPAHLDLE